MINRSRIAAIIIGVGCTSASLSLLGAPQLPEWSQYSGPDADSRSLRLRSSESVVQTVVQSQFSNIDAAIVWLDASQDMPVPSDVELKVTNGDRVVSALAFAIQDTGRTVFQLEEPLKISQKKTSLELVNRGQKPLYFLHHLDDTKFRDGTMEYKPNQRKIGDLVFQIRYLRPALVTTYIQLGMIASLIMAGLITASFIWQSQPWKPTANLTTDTIMAIGIFSCFLVIYLMLLIKPGIWTGPGDFTKDVSYVTASSEAIKAGQFPAWSHYTCGGMGLIGNPEGNTLSLATLIALIINPERALWITLALEAALAATGTYVLARTLSIRSMPSLLAGIIVGASPTLAYKLVEGFSMLGGVAAFTPWVLAAYYKSTKRLVPWAPLAGILLGVIFWRGDVHVIIGLILVVTIWSFFEVLRKKTWQKISPLILIAAVTWLVASPKLLAYLEQPNLINTNVDPHVVLLGEDRLWDDALFKVHPRHVKVPVQHGLPEHFGYVGMYIGYIVAFLALIGFITKHKHRWTLLLATTAILVIVDGALYNNYLSQVPYLDSVLRMPSRLSLVLLPLLALSAALGVEYLQSKIRWRFLTLLFTVAIVIDLGWATASLLTNNLSTRANSISKPDVPTLAVHQNHSQNDRHASQLLSAGYLLPQICGDQNAPPEFLNTLENFTPLSNNEITLTPNQINWTEDANPPFMALARFTSSWVGNTGLVVPEANGSLQLIPAKDSDQNFARYLLSTAPAQKGILVSILVFVVVILLPGITTNTKNDI